MGIIAAGIAAAAIGAGATAASGVMSADASRHAANQAADSQKSANDLNYSMFQQAHGSKGSAVLPTYLTGANGGLFEPQLGSALTGAFDQNNVPLSAFQAATGKTAGAQSDATDLANSVFNGGVTAGMRRNAAPVQAARTATARSSAMDALNKTLDSIDATQASRGYVGDDYGNRLLKFQAGATAGNAMGAADIANKQQTADITNYGDYTLPLQNMQLPFNMAQQGGQMAFLPNDQYLASLGQRMQPLNMLKLGYTGPFQYQPLPTPGPGAFSGAANALGAAAGGAGQLGGAMFQQYQQQQARDAASALSAQQAQQYQSMINSIYGSNGAGAGNPLLYGAAGGSGGGALGLSGGVPDASSSVYNDAAGGAFGG